MSLSFFPPCSVGSCKVTVLQGLVVFKFSINKCVYHDYYWFVLTLKVSTASFLLTTASFTIKVVYDHTHIASYRHWGVRSAGLLHVRLLALDGRSAELVGGLPSGPILSGLSWTGPVKWLSCRGCVSLGKFICLLWFGWGGTCVWANP